MNFYSTGEVAKRLNISVRTLRYYDQIGLLIPTEKDEHGKRLYNNEDLLTLEKITILKKLNLSLKDIEKVLSKVTIKKLLEAHRESLYQKREELNRSIEDTNRLLNIVDIEGQLNWKQLIHLIKNAEIHDHKVGRNWADYFEEHEQLTLRERLPKMESDDIHVRKWINVCKRVELCIARGDTPDSEEGQIIAEDAEILSTELFSGNAELANKFFEIRKSPEKSRELNLYPIREEVMDFFEQAILVYDHNKLKV